MADILEGCGAIAYDDNGDTTVNLADAFVEHKGEDIYIVLGGCRYGEALDIADAFTKSSYVEDDGVVVAMLEYAC